MIHMRCTPEQVRGCEGRWGCGFGECLGREAEFQRSLPPAWRGHQRLIKRGPVDARVELQEVTRDPADWALALVVWGLVAMALALAVALVAVG